MNSKVGEEWGRAKTILSHFVVVVSRDSAEKKCNQTITGLHTALITFWKYTWSKVAGTTKLSCFKKLSKFSTWKK